jgi:HEAT repeat protein
MAAEITALIEKFRSGDEDAAFHGLIELPNDTLPAVIDYFRMEPLGAIRALLVKAIWERRDPSAVSFLAEALQDHEEEVWQEALDGLVTLASSEALNVLQSAKTRRPTDAENHRRFHLWLEEAIQQIQFELRRR